MKNKKTITAKQLRKKLNLGPVKFYFEKKDGTIRRAYGTRNIDLIPESKAPKGKESSPSILAFYDLDNKDWRSLNVKTEIVLA